MQSPHDYQLKPSQVTMMQDADLVLYISPNLETFLARPLAALPKDVRQVAMINKDGLRTYNMRDDAAGDAPSGPAAKDPHIWTAIGNAKIMVAYIIRELTELHPQNAVTYINNGTVVMNRLEELDRKLKAQLAPVKGRPYVAFHDAFQYFEHDYGLNGVGFITREPGQEPSAKRIEAVRAKIKDMKVGCVFSEPEFNSQLVKTVTEGTDAHTGIIDELGAAIPDGPDQYFTMMHQAGDSFAHCLTP
jgi:zinc transport system substrate-binding protein